MAGTVSFNCIGEILQMTHVARGVNEEGVLTVDVVMSGKVPVLPADVHVTVLPYDEQYIQTSPGLLSFCLFLCVCLCAALTLV